MRPILRQTQPLEYQGLAPAEPPKLVPRVELEIPVEAPVACTDGVCGRCAIVLINPVTELLTHLVVREPLATDMGFVVPVESVAGTAAGTILLSYTLADLAGLDPFIETEYIENKVPHSEGRYDRMYATGQLYYWPFVGAGVGAETMLAEPEERAEIQLGQLPVRRGTRVEALDGPVGRVDEFVVNSKGGHITHLVMREGHAWAPKDVIIPISALDDVRRDTVFLKLDKHDIKILPDFPVQRRWA